LVDDVITSQGGVAGAISSLQIMSDCCKDARYGDTFLKTILWILDLMHQLAKLEKTPSQMTPVDRWILYARFLLNGNIARDSVGATCTSYHQANNNVVDLMKVAHDRDAMITMLEFRLAPQNYRQKDTSVPISTAIAKKADAVFKDFTSTIMSKTILGSLSHCITLTKPTPTTASIGFGGRCVIGNANGTVDVSPSQLSTISQIKTVIGLMDYLKENPSSDLFMEVAGSPMVIATTSTLDFLRVPFIWGHFNSDTSLSLYDLSGYHRVSHILPLWKHTTFEQAYFGIEGAIPKRRLGHMCQETYLKTEYQRELGRAFQKIGIYRCMNIPSDPSCGFGACALNSRDHIIDPIKMRLNGIDLVITHLF
jgi:hypothetical protein